MLTEASARPRLLDADDVAVWLKLSVPQVYRLVRENRLPAVRLGRYYRFDPVAVDRFLADGGRGLDDER